MSEAKPCVTIVSVHTWSVGEDLTHRFNLELGTGRVTAIDGRVLVVQFADATLRFAVTSDALIPEAETSRRRELSLIERLAAGEIDDTDDFLTRLDILHLLATREADGLGSFLGGRVRLFPPSCMWPSARRCGCRCGGCSPTKWDSARRSRRR
ncbi:MAG TPA: hypothetical protein VNJ03_17090 [Vicinamibacterales bacterium]|nr:hypothetical protein [Vicinamibacterales bacterium]